MCEAPVPQASGDLSQRRSPGSRAGGPGSSPSCAVSVAGLTLSSQGLQSPGDTPWNCPFLGPTLPTGRPGEGSATSVPHCALGPTERVGWGVGSGPALFLLTGYIGLLGTIKSEQTPLLLKKPFMPG